MGIKMNTKITFYVNQNIFQGIKTEGHTEANICSTVSAFMGFLEVCAEKHANKYALNIDRETPSRSLYWYESEIMSTICEDIYATLKLIEREYPLNIYVEKTGITRGCRHDGQ